MEKQPIKRQTGIVAQIPLSLFDELADVCLSWNHQTLETELERWIVEWDEDHASAVNLVDANR